MIHKDKVITSKYQSATILSLYTIELILHKSVNMIWQESSKSNHIKLQQQISEQCLTSFESYIWSVVKKYLVKGTTEAPKKKAEIINSETLFICIDRRFMLQEATWRIIQQLGIKSTSHWSHTTLSGDVKWSLSTLATVKKTGNSPPNSQNKCKKDP